MLFEDLKLYLRLFHGQRREEFLAVCDLEPLAHAVSPWFQVCQELEEGLKSDSDFPADYPKETLLKHLKCYAYVNV